MIAVDEGPGVGCISEGFVRLLSFTARVTSNSPDMLRDLASLYPGAETSVGRPVPSLTPPLMLMEYASDAGGRRYWLYDGDEEISTLDSAPDAVACTESAVNSAAMAGLSRHLLVHAAVVAAANGGIVLPAPSGTGKSTLTAALCLSGFRYLSDEIAVLDVESLAALPFLKAICLKDGGWETLRSFFESPASLLDAVRANGERVHFLAAPHRLSQDGRVQVRFVVLPVRRSGAPATLVSVSRATALAELARHSLNIPRHGWSGVEALARMVEGAECYRLIYHDLRDAVSVVSALAGHPERGRRGTAARTGVEQVTARWQSV